MTSEAAKERTKVIHELKTHPPYFAAIESGEKQFEIRKNDRGYQVGDTLMLYEYEPEAGRYTGNGVARQVTYIAQGVFGLPEDVCVMSLAGYEAARPAPADDAARVAELEQQVERYRAALDRLAMFDDAGANEHLKRTGDYGAFDEPGAVQVARAALKEEKG